MAAILSRPQYLNKKEAGARLREKQVQRISFNLKSIREEKN